MRARMHQKSQTTCRDAKYLLKDGPRQTQTKYHHLKTPKQNKQKFKLNLRSALTLFTRRQECTMM